MLGLSRLRLARQEFLHLYPNNMHTSCTACLTTVMTENLSCKELY
jgi:hypothetical protein